MAKVNLSTDSMQSSSGVSSTGSLHLSIGSEWEDQGTGGASAAATPTPFVTHRQITGNIVIFHT